MATFGGWSRYARRASKVTQVALAARANVAHSTIVRIERDQVTPTIETVWRFPRQFPTVNSSR